MPSSQHPAQSGARLGRGAALDAEITNLNRQVVELQSMLNNAYLLVNDPANAFLAREPWSKRVRAMLGEIKGCMGPVRHG